MDKEISCKGIKGDGSDGCEYDSAWLCQNPECKTPVLTSTLLGAHPNGCPKLCEWNRGKPEEKPKRDMKQPFRYGGFFHDYEASAQDFGQEECFLCGRKFKEGEKPYCTTAEVEPGKFMFKIICRECAYQMNLGVVERDGETYEHIEDFTETGVGRT